MNKQLKSPRLIILVMILSLMSVLVAGCGDDKYVQSVKNGTMYMAPNAPVGKAFKMANGNLSFPIKMIVL